MNERINDLLSQSGIELYPQQFNQLLEGYVDIIELEKFAELIVRECADIATINAHQWQSPGTYVLKHFGIE